MKSLAGDALAYVEEMFKKNGAVPAPEINEKRRDELELRPSCKYSGIYYRAEYTQIDNQPVIIIYATEDPKFAELGLEDGIAAFPAGLPKEKLEKEVRFAMDLEPYPETYPDY